MINREKRVERKQLENEAFPPVQQQIHFGGRSKQLPSEWIQHPLYQRGRRPVLGTVSLEHHPGMGR